VQVRAGDAPDLRDTAAVGDRAGNAVAGSLQRRGDGAQIQRRTVRCVDDTGALPAQIERTGQCVAAALETRCDRDDRRRWPAVPPSARRPTAPLPAR
jgi:hypothetical protein